MGLMGSVLVVVLLLGSAATRAAELYKWVDEKGVTNYSNTPPARTGDGRPASIVEDRLSIYTPEEPVTEAIERAKERYTQPRRSAPGGMEPERRVPPPPAPLLPPQAPPSTTR